MSKYRDEQLAQLEVVRKKRQEAAAAFLDRSRSVDERMSLAPSMGTFNDSEAPTALAIVRNAEEPPIVRAAALNGLTSALRSDTTLLEEVIDLAGDPKMPTELRHVALNALQGLRFSSERMASLRPRHRNMLRGLLDDADPSLRQLGAEYLSLERDEFAQRRLLEGLREPEKAPVAPELAVQFLAYDLHADALPMLRDVARHPPNAAAKREALRNLATDPDSTTLLAEVLQNGSEDPETRHISAVALYQLNAPLATKLSKGIVLDEGNDDEFRAALLNTMTYLGEQANTKQDDGFASEVERLANETVSPQLKQMARTYCERSQSRAVRVPKTHTEHE